MASAADARAKERTRVKSGIMNGLGRLLLYRDKAEKVEGNSTVEATHWSQVPLRSLEYVPPGVEAGVRLTKNMRKSRALFKAKQQAPFKAFVFARIEEGKKKNHSFKGFSVLRVIPFPPFFLFFEK